jgi:hydroxymethylglutaryl-CoA lyase
MIQLSRNSLKTITTGLQEGFKFSQLENGKFMGKKFVKIFDVTLRDGIQNLKSNSLTPIFSPEKKLHVINQLISAGVKQIEFGSNVSHKLVEMSNTRHVVNLFETINPEPDLKLCLLVPNNKKYMETFSWAQYHQINKYSLITACSEGFVGKNTQMTLEENFNELDRILSNPGDFRLYVSCCFGCPIEGPTNSKHLDNLRTIINKYSSQSNISEIVLSDTIGSYNMEQLDEYMRLFKSTGKISLHIHSDEHDKNIAKIIENYYADIVSIDTSMGNIGGCPSVEKSKIKPNLSTLKVAEIINQIEDNPVYDINQIADLEIQVRQIIQSNL